MTLSTILTVGLGLVLIYYLLGLIVNIFTQIIKDILELRARALEAMLIDMMKDENGDESAAKEAYDKIMAQPLVRSLQPLYGRFLGQGKRKVDKIPSQTFSLVLLEYLGTFKEDSEFLANTAHRTINEVLEQMKPLLASVPEGDREALTVRLNDELTDLLAENDINALLSGLRRILAQLQVLLVDEDSDWKKTLTTLERLIDLLQGTPEMQLEALRSGINNLPEGSKARGALTSLIDFNVQDIEEARTRIERWFDESMDNASGLFKRYTRAWVIAVSFVVTFLLGGSTFQIAQALAQQPIDLSSIAATVESLSAIDPNRLEPGQEVDLSQRIDDLGTAVTTLTDLSLPIPWWQEGFSDNTINNILTVAGLLITWGFVSQGSSFWYDILKMVKGGSSTSSSDTTSPKTTETTTDQKQS